MKKTLTYLSLFVPAIVIVVFFLAQNFVNKVESSSSDNTSGWAWSENIGWISINCTDNGSCAAGSDYGVNINLSTGDVAGAMWSENIGWISFERSITNNPPEDPYKSTPGAIAKYDSNTKEVSGWARAIAGCQDDPNIIATSCSSSGAGLTTLDWDGWIKLQNVTYNDTTGKLDGWAWGGEVVGWIDFSLLTLAPSGSISASTCEIPKNGTSCTSRVTWISQNFLGNTSVLQGASEFSNVPTDNVGVDRQITPENKIFVIKDLGGVFSFQTSANTSCEVGSNWDSTTHRCEEVAVLPVAPTIDISASPTLVRKGKTADITVNITSVDQLNCTIYGVDLADNTFSHNGSALPTPHNFTTKELNSAQTVKVKCEVVSAPVVVTEKEIRINVVSTGGEI